MRRKDKLQKDVSHSPPRIFCGSSAGKTLKRCKNNGKTDNIDVIDIDDDEVENINEDSSASGKENKYPSNIICLDEEDEVSDQNQPATSVEVGAGFASDASSSSMSPPPKKAWNSSDEDDDECQILHDISSPVKLSSKRTYCAKAPSKSRNGFGFDLDGDESDKAQHDSEYMEDTSGEIQAVWERANKRKKDVILGSESVKDSQPTTSVAQPIVEVEKGKRPAQYSKDPVHLDSGKVSGKENITSHFAGVEKTRCNTAFHKMTRSANSDMKSTEETKEKEAACSVRMSRGKGKQIGIEAFFGPMFRNNLKNVCERARKQHSVDTKIGDGISSCSSRFEDGIKKRSSNLSDKGNLASDEPLNSKPTCETRVSEDLETAYGKCAGKDPPSDMPDKRVIVGCQELVKPVPKEPSLGNTLQHNEAETESNRAAPQEDKDEAGEVDTFRDCLINDREKLKKTDEYKRAEEEEWASRQQALRLQAEEAQRMRQVLKRKKAESLRLLDMERRQKQRIEEIRETQKKDEENMSMKEKFRAEVRVELKQLETKCLDMGSLLRGLGVHVSGGLQPQPHEIRAAYKKALLSFHPDRAPSSDIRKLVEAEEKFKLISRMKEKLLPIL